MAADRRNVNIQHQATSELCQVAVPAVQQLDRLHHAIEQRSQYLPVDEADLHSLDKLPTKLELLKEYLHHIAVPDAREQELVRQQTPPICACWFRSRPPLLLRGSLHTVCTSKQGTTLTKRLRELRDQLTILKTVLQHRQHAEHQRAETEVSSARVSSTQES